MGKILELTHVNKAYREGGMENRVLRDLSFSVEEGEFTAVMGPSGSGKSTLLFCAGGMDTIDSGEIELCEKKLSTLSEDALSEMRRRETGFVFQQPSLLKNLNILDNVMLTALRGNKKNASAIKKKALALMEKAQIAELAQREVSKVSGGQLQRAGVCRALMNDARLLFCDEPTGALNSRSAQEIMDLFSAVNSEGTAILLVTHDALVAARSERVIFMRDGAIVSELRLGKYAGEGLAERMSRVGEAARTLGI